jgi:drug/metabolite transporter (DMT)-like permease
MQALPSKARLLTAIVVLSNLLGNALLSFGMKGSKGMAWVFSPAVLAGICLLVLWTLTRTTLMSWTDLSYLLPLTASGYVLTAIVGFAFLHEQVSGVRWAATLLIVAGVILAGSTPPRTSGKREC